MFPFYLVSSGYTPHAGSPYLPASLNSFVFHAASIPSFYIYQQLSCKLESYNTKQLIFSFYARELLYNGAWGASIPGNFYNTGQLQYQV